MKNVFDFFNTFEVLPITHYTYISTSKFRTRNYKYKLIIKIEKRF